MKKKWLYKSPGWYLFARCLITFLTGFAAGLFAGTVFREDAAGICQTGMAAGAAFMLAAGYIGGMFRILKSDV